MIKIKFVSHNGNFGRAGVNQAMVKRDPREILTEDIVLGPSCQSQWKRLREIWTRERSYTLYYVLEKDAVYLTG